VETAKNENRKKSRKNKTSIQKKYFLVSGRVYVETAKKKKENRKRVEKK